MNYTTRINSTVDNINAKHGADIVIAPVPMSSGYSAWQQGKMIAEGSAAAMRLIAAGASASGMSVYDLESDCYIAGTVEQLVGSDS